MKRAQIYAVSVEVICPFCNEPIKEPAGGSFKWGIASPRLTKGSVLNCPSCGEKSEVPDEIYPSAL